MVRARYHQRSYPSQAGYLTSDTYLPGEARGGYLLSCAVRL